MYFFLEKENNEKVFFNNLSFTWR